MGHVPFRPGFPARLSRTLLFLSGLEFCIKNSLRKYPYQDLEVTMPSFRNHCSPLPSFEHLRNNISDLAIRDLGTQYL